MLLKRQAKNKLYDLLHHGTVWCCMGITVLSTAYLGYYGYKYFTDVRPKQKLEQLKKIKDDGNITDNTKTLATQNTSSIKNNTKIVKKMNKYINEDIIVKVVKIQVFE